MNKFENVLPRQLMVGVRHFLAIYRHGTLPLEAFTAALGKLRVMLTRRQVALLLPKVRRTKGRGGGRGEVDYEVSRYTHTLPPPPPHAYIPAHYRTTGRGGRRGALRPLTPQHNPAPRTAGVLRPRSRAPRPRRRRWSRTPRRGRGAREPHRAQASTSARPFTHVPRILPVFPHSRTNRHSRNIYYSCTRNPMPSIPVYSLCL